MLKKNLRRILSLILTFALVLTAFPQITYASSGEYIMRVDKRTAYADGGKYKFETEVKNINNRVMVPIKEYAYFLGGEFIGWNAETGEATVEIDGREFTYRYQSSEYTCDGMTYYMDNVADIIDEKLYVEARSVPEFIDMYISYYDGYCVIGEYMYDENEIMELANYYYDAGYGNEYEETCNHELYTDYYATEYCSGNYNTEEHEIVEIYNRYCNDCGAYLDQLTTGKVGTHEYQENVCIICGHKAEEQAVSEDNTQYIEPQYTEEPQEWFEPSDTAIPDYLIEPSVTPEEETFATDTPNYCMHETTYEVEGECEWRKSSSLKICKIGNIPVTVICDECGQIVDSYSKLTYITEHSLITENCHRFCQNCDYTEDLEHDECTTRTYEYEVYDEEKHICRETTVTYCKRCKEEFESRTITYKIDHHYGNYAECLDCGYFDETQTTCDHEEKSRFLENEYEYCDEGTHCLVTTFESYCRICGEEFGIYQTREYLDHIVENGRCGMCGVQLYEIPEVSSEYIEDDYRTFADTIVLHINDDIGYCDGNKVSWNVTPKLKNNKTMVPLKQFAQLLGGKFVAWDAQTKSATIEVNGTYLTYTVGSRSVVGNDLPMKNPAEIVDNTMYVEITSIVAATNYKVSFYDNYCVVTGYDLAKETVHDYATAYYGADFSTPLVTQSDINQARNRIDELEQIIAGAKNAYNAGTITNDRKNEIISEAENSVDEYQEVINGERQLADVTEKGRKYKASTGSQSSVVEEIQEKLLELDYTSQTITGRFDATTFNNVAYFQIISNLPVTGWLDNATIKEINSRYSSLEKDTTGESSAIKSYSVKLDENSKYVTIEVECESGVDRICVTLSGDYKSDMQTAYSNKAKFKLDIPYSDEYVTYRLMIGAYKQNNVVGKVSTTVTACRNKSILKGIGEQLVNGTAMLSGVVTGVVNGAVVQPIFAVSSGLDHVINFWNPEQYAYNEEWRAGLIEKIENFMISAIPAEQYYYYNCGIAGGEIAEFSVGTVLLVNNIAGKVTSVKEVGNGVKTAQLMLDSGEEVVVVTAENSSNVAVVAATKVDDVVKAVDEVSIIPDKGFSTFDSLKDYLGKAGKDFQWHHIVEQGQIEKSGFAAEKIHNLKNVVRIPGGYKGSIHSKISGYYNSTKNSFTGGLSVRNWLIGQSFEAQLEFGIERLRELGQLFATSEGWVFIPFE